jgi:hypothetical protein
MERSGSCLDNASRTLFVRSRSHGRAPPRRRIPSTRRRRPELHTRAASTTMSVSSAGMVGELRRAAQRTLTTIEHHLGMLVFCPRPRHLLHQLSGPSRCFLELRASVVPKSSGYARKTCSGRFALVEQLGQDFNLSFAHWDSFSGFEQCEHRMCPPDAAFNSFRQRSGPGTDLPRPQAGDRLAPEVIGMLRNQ